MTLLKLMIPGLFASVLTCFPQNQAPQKMWTVVIDAGHGGKDPGALGSISKEKNINLAIALKAGEYIKQNVKNARVLYTRITMYLLKLKKEQNLPIRIKLFVYRYMLTGQARKA